jgi:hypothetical protein
LTVVERRTVVRLLEATTAALRSIAPAIAPPSPLPKLPTTAGAG